MNNIPNKVVFYDGDCGFCNRSVNYILKKEKKQEIHFAPIQGRFTKENFGDKIDTLNLETIYFSKNGILYNRSTAALLITKELKFPNSILILFYIVPKFIRDYFYNFIAKRRHRIAKGFCYIPSKEEKKRFLN